MFYVLCYSCQQQRPYCTRDHRCTVCRSEFIIGVNGELPEWRAPRYERPVRDRSLAGDFRPTLHVTEDGQIVQAQSGHRTSFDMSEHERRAIMARPDLVVSFRCKWVAGCHFATVSPTMLANVRFETPKPLDCIICLCTIEAETEAFFCKNHPMCYTCAEHAHETHVLIYRNCTVCTVTLW